jgi:hypothetical protein
MKGAERRNSESPGSDADTTSGAGAGSNCATWLVAGETTDSKIMAAGNLGARSLILDLSRDLCALLIFAPVWPERAPNLPWS